MMRGFFINQLFFHTPCTPLPATQIFLNGQIEKLTLKIHSGNFLLTSYGEHEYAIYSAWKHLIKPTQYVFRFF